MTTPDVAQLVERLDRIEQDLELQIRETRRRNRQLGKPRRSAWLEWVTGLSVPIVLALGMAVIQNRENIARIEETRFTRGDALEMESRILERVNEVPSWLRNNLSEIKASVRDIQSRMRELEKR